MMSSSLTNGYVSRYGTDSIDGSGKYFGTLMRPNAQDNQERTWDRMLIEQRLAAMGMGLPEAPRMPAGFPASFAWTRNHDDRIFVSGHSAQLEDGSMAGPFGRVPDEVPIENALTAARGAALSVLASLQRELGDLDRVTAWLTVQGFVNTVPGYEQTTIVVNAFSDLILELYGPERGHHARTAIGASALPMNNTVVVAAEVAFA